MRTELDNFRSKRVLLDPAAYFDDRRMELDRLRDKVASSMENALGVKKREQIRLAAALDALSPLQVLIRGYAVASDEKGRIVTGTAMIRKGSRLRLKFSDGSADCTVENVNEELHP